MGGRELVSGLLVLVVIAGAWAFVLVPLVRNRHDAVTELRSVDRFAGAMRVLSRKRASGPPGARYVSGIRPPTRPVVSRPSTAHRPAPRTASASDLTLRRRRRTLTAMTLLVVASLAFVVLSPSVVAVGCVVLSLAVLGLTLAWLRHQAREDAARRARQARRRAPQSSARPAPARAPMVAPRSAPAEEEYRIPAHLLAPPPRAARVAVEERPAPPPAPVVDEAPVVYADEAYREYAPDYDDQAELVPAPAWGVKVLDMTTPGQWTRTRIFEDAPAEGFDGLLIEDDEVEQLFDQKRAAG
ncbi:MAG TPA: hypothetical protein VHE83_10830 [Mycobacteriales bacterium]|nr:hypothetical protein [Mycobacteriales bacterium]